MLLTAETLEWVGTSGYVSLENKTSNRNRTIQEPTKIIPTLHSQNYPVVEGENMANSKIILNNSSKILFSPVYVEYTKDGQHVVYRTNDMAIDKPYIVFWNDTHYIFVKEKDGVKMYETEIQKT